MNYPHSAIDRELVPQAVEAAYQHVLDTYASETNKTISVWRAFSNAHLPFRPHPKSSSVEEILKHELLSARRFFGEFLDAPEVDPGDVLPQSHAIEEYCRRLRNLARRRLDFLASRTEEWWLSEAAFFDTTRQHIWIFWRRVLHSAHHRTQLTVYLRLLDKPVPSVYGPTADVTWTGADPTHTVEASGRN